MVFGWFFVVSVGGRCAREWVWTGFLWFQQSMVGARVVFDWFFVVSTPPGSPGIGFRLVFLVSPKLRQDSSLSGNRKKALIVNLGNSLAPAQKTVACRRQHCCGR